MTEQSKLKDTQAQVAEDAPQSGFGVSRNPDGTRMRNPESVNTTKDSEETNSEKDKERKSA